MVQRNGRILRQFNSCDEVFIFRYITPGTFDSYSWQLLESKERFISSFLSGSCKNREAVDIGETVLSYSEIKAACIGNRLVKRRVETSNLIQRKKILSSQRQGELFKAAALAEKLPEKIQKLKEHRQIVEKDELLYKESKEKLSNSERSSFGEELLYALSENNLFKKERVFSEYQGFTIVLPANMLTDKPYVLIKSKNKGVYFLDMKEVKTPIGCTKSLDYFFENLDKRKDEISKEIHNENQNLRMAKQDLRKGNPYESEVKDLYKKLEVIDYEIENQNKENE